VVKWFGGGCWAWGFAAAAAVAEVPGHVLSILSEACHLLLVLLMHRHAGRGQAGDDTPRKGC